MNFLEFFQGIYTFFHTEPEIALGRLLLVALGLLFIYLAYKQILESLIMLPLGIGMIAVNGGLMVLEAGHVSSIVTEAGAPVGTLVRVRGIGNLGGFVRVDRFFKSLDVVESVVVERLEPDQALLRLRLRGGVDALSRSATVGGVLAAEPLEPVLPGSAAGVAGTESPQLPDLSFRLLE